MIGLKRQCAVEGCSRGSKSYGYCNMHYKRWKRTGSFYRRDHRDIEGRIADNSVLAEGGCILWTAATNSKGYGQIRIEGETLLVHRVVWERAHGPLSEGEVVDHFECYTPACVNLDHLTATSPGSNNFNREGPNKNNTSGYRNVSFRKKRSKWGVKVTHRGRTQFGGYFNTPEEANEAAIALREKVKLNTEKNGAER